VCGLKLPHGFQHPLIHDSKKLSPAKRCEALTLIFSVAQWIMIEAVSPARIDHENIYRATQQAMLHIAQLSSATLVLTDAMPLPHASKEVRAYVKGDQRSISIAAASIVAKETRDAIMLHYDGLYPMYGFKQHKGYPTPQHLAALRQHGISPIHRLSFKPVSDLLHPSLFD
jgi:ribonuclease HII